MTTTTKAQRDLLSLAVELLQASLENAIDDNGQPTYPRSMANAIEFAADAIDTALRSGILGAEESRLTRSETVV